MSFLFSRTDRNWGGGERGVGLWGEKGGLEGFGGGFGMDVGIELSVGLGPLSSLYIFTRHFSLRLAIDC